MKKAFNLSLLAIIALALPYSLTHAEKPAVVGSDLSASVKPAKPVATNPPAKPAVETPVAPLTLTEKKAKAETDLRAIHAQFSLFVTRTQAAIDRLASKDIDTAKAQTELTAAKASLDAAKANLDLFALIIITDETPDLKSQPDTSEIKTTLKKIQDNLKSARTHLIESLITLKATITISIDAQ